MKKILNSRIGQWLAGRLIALVVYIVRLTCKCHYHNKPAISKTVAIYAAWHGRLLMLPYLVDSNTKALISEHRDGIIISEAAKSFGIETISGSSTRGGSKALREILKTLKNKTNLFITPDGPKGPARQAKPGVLEAARISTAPIIPMSFAATKFWRTKSWDGFTIPKPFSTIHLVYGEPFHIAKDLTSAEKDTLLKDIEQALTAVEQKADSLCA